MVLLNRITIKSLKLNKNRTIVTIIGIILATALITGITTLVSSFLKSTIEHAKITDGNYHYEFIDVPQQEVEEIKNNKNVESLFVTQNLGNGIMQSEKETLNFNVQIIGASKDAMQNLGMQLIEGKMPENENEIVISSSIEKYEKIKLEIGEEITIINSENSTKKYKIVGIVNITDNNLEPQFTSNCYTIITNLNNFAKEEKLNVYVRYKDLSTRIETAVQILKVDEQTYNKLKTENRKQTEENLSINESNRYIYYINNNLITLEIGDFKDQTLSMIYAVSAVIIGIVIITSVYCIKNSFNISITEKIKQYGMLASIGATSKQIKRSVLYEAFILGIISIPIGIIIGTFSIYLVLKIIEQIFFESLNGMQFKFATNVYAVGIATLLSILTIYLSARKSAKKASKISPIEAIRNNQEIKIKSKTIKSSKLIKKIFGVGGDIAYKNLKRNKQKYRTTVVTIIISVSVFISMFSFTNYAFKVSEIYYKKYKYNVFLFDGNNERLKEISQDSKINIYPFSLLRMARVIDKNAQNHRSKEAEEIGFFENHKELNFYILSLGKEEYKRYIKRIGLDYEKTKNKAVLMDYKTELINIDGNKKHIIFRQSDYKSGDIIQFKKYIIDEDDVNEQTKNETFELEIAKITEENPIGLEKLELGSALLIVSDEFMDNMGLDYSTIGLFIDAKNDKELEEYVKENYSDACEYIGNMAEEEREQNAMLYVITISLYLFIIVISLIGITNIFNTITTSMELRQKEFAMLKSIGMTKKEFNKMIRLESIFYGLKSLIIGVPLGICLSYLIYKGFVKNVEMAYILPIKEIIITILVVFILVGIIMKYSLNKINKQNIIETIRKDNI